MSAEEIYNYLKEQVETGGLGVEDLPSLKHYDYKDVLGEVEVVGKGGGADKGSDWFRVLHFKEHDVYLKISGWYQSHCGTEFDDFESAVSIVRPAEKVITVFNKI